MSVLSANQLDPSGVCRHCSKNAQTEFMECITCMRKIHVLNCTDHPDLCTKTFLEKNWSTFTRLYPNITFTCPQCLDDKKLGSEQVMSNRLSSIEENIERLAANMAVISKRLEENEVHKERVAFFDAINTSPTRISAPAPKLTFAETLKAKKPAVIVVQPDDSDGNSATDSEPMSEVSVQSSLDKIEKAAVSTASVVTKTYKNKRGHLTIVCENENAKQTLLPHVEEVFPDKKVTAPVSRLPTIAIAGFTRNYSNEEFLRIATELNRSRGIPITSENAKVLFIREVAKQNGEYQAVLRVSEELRESINRAGDRVCIGLNACKVYDRFHIRRCNKCQLFHHHKDECKSRVFVCGKCSHNHDTRECNVGEDKYRCHNCAINGYSPADLKHQTSSLQCMSYKKEQDKLKGSIFYYQNKAKN